MNRHLESDPWSDLKLIFKDNTGVKHKSNKFKYGDLILWDIDMSDHLRCHHSRKLIDFVQVC